jgi:hypothetical protein
MIRQTLMYCIDFVAFMETPDKGWQIIAEEHGKLPPEIDQYSLIFDQGAYFFKNLSEMPFHRCCGQVFLGLLSFTGH